MSIPFFYLLAKCDVPIPVSYLRWRTGNKILQHAHVVHPAQENPYLRNTKVRSVKLSSFICIQPIWIFAFFYLLAFTGFGLMISNFARTQQQAMFVILFFLIIFILISGLFTPVSSMPDWAQKLTYINPLRYFVEVMRLIYLKGSGFMDILPNLIRIVSFAIGLNGLAIVSYRKTTE